MAGALQVWFQVFGVWLCAAHFTKQQVPQSIAPVAPIEKFRAHWSPLCYAAQIWFKFLLSSKTSLSLLRDWLVTWCICQLVISITTAYRVIIFILLGCSFYSKLDPRQYEICRCMPVAWHTLSCGRYVRAFGRSRLWQSSWLSQLINLGLEIQRPALG